MSDAPATGSRAMPNGAKTAGLCRRHGISSATFYAWKAKFGGMEPSEAKRLKAVEDANAKLKRLLAEAVLDNTGLKYLPGRVSDLLSIVDLVAAS